MANQVLLLHSGGMSSRQWRRLVEDLRPDYQVLAPDLLGSGANPAWPWDEPYHHDQDLEILEGLIPAEGLHLVGHSFGGFLAMLLARRHPDRIRSLTVYDPVNFGMLTTAGDAEGLADLQRTVGNPIFLDDSVGGTGPWWEVFCDYWNGPGSWQAMPEPSREAFLSTGRKAYREVRSLIQELGSAQSYAVFRGPALLCNGEHTPLAARRVVELLAERLPGARIERVAGAGHMGPITHAAVFNRLVREHLKGL